MYYEGQWYHISFKLTMFDICRIQAAEYERGNNGWGLLVRGKLMGVSSTTRLHILVELMTRLCDPFPGFAVWACL